MSGSRTQRLFSAALLAGLVAASSPSAHAGASLPDQLLAHVPASAPVVVATEHKTLSKHPHYLDVLRFMVSQGWGGGLEVLSSLGVDLAGDAKTTVNYRTVGGGEGLLAKLSDVGALRQRAGKTQGAAFSASEIAGRPAFSLNRDLHAVELGAGVILVGRKKLIEENLAAIGKGQVITKKKAFRGLSARAKKLGSALWGVVFVPKSTRARLTKRGSADIAATERIVFGVSGLGPTTLAVEAVAGSPEGAQGALKGIQSKIDRKILGSTMLKALGVGVLVKQIKLSTSGSTVNAKMTLTAPQVGLLSRLAGRLVSAL